MKIEYNFSSRPSIEILIGYSILAGLIFFSILNTPFYDAKFTLCIFKNLSGMPCPGCGMTRALLFLGHGNIQEAMMMNPNSVIVSLIIISMFANKTSQIFAGREMRLHLTKKEKITVFVFFILLMITAWFYNLTSNPFI